MTPEELLELTAYGEAILQSSDLPDLKEAYGRPIDKQGSGQSRISRIGLRLCGRKTTGDWKFQVMNQQG